VVPGWSGSTPPGADFFAAKGVLETLLGALRVDFEVVRGADPFLHPGRAARVLVAGEDAGWLGELHPAIAAEWDLGVVAGFELDLGAVLGHAARERVACEVVRVADVVDTGQQGAEHLAVGDDAAHRDAAEVDAVITALAADELRACGFASDAVVSQCDLQRSVDGLGARVREEHVIETRRRDLDHGVGEREGRWVPHLEGRCVVHCFEL